MEFTHFYPFFGKARLAGEKSAATAHRFSVEYRLAKQTRQGGCRAMNDTKIASKAKAQLANFMGKVFARFLKPAKKGGPGSVPAMADTEVGPPDNRRPPCAPPEVLVLIKIFLDQHQNHFRPASKPTTSRRSSSCRASLNSLTPTTDSRLGRETPKTTSRNALQPLSMRVRRISTLKK